MISTLCNVWNDFSMWVSNEWSQMTFYIVISILCVLGLFGFLSFFKKSWDKGKRPKWGLLIVSALMFGLMALLFFARF